MTPDQTAFNVAHLEPLLGGAGTRRLFLKARMRRPWTMSADSHFGLLHRQLVQRSKSSHCQRIDIRPCLNASLETRHPYTIEAALNQEPCASQPSF